MGDSIFTMNALKPQVALIGRANVGKSTLFNRLIEEEKSLVSATSGTTRDRFEADCIWRGKAFTLVDTGGLDIDGKDVIEQEISKQAMTAIAESDVVVFVVDAQAGLQPGDRALASTLMKTGVPIVYAANKADNARIRSGLNESEWLKFPLMDPIPVSAKQSKGTGDLLDGIFEALESIQKQAVEVEDINAIKVAVIGKPNVGKSSLLNAMLGKERFIASTEEHTTRSSNDVLVEHGGDTFMLVDTAGVRRMARVRNGDSKLEQAGVEQSIRSMKRAHVVLFVIDVTKNIHYQDKYLAGQIEDTGASAIIVANKWDLVPDKDTGTINEYERYIRAHLPSLAYCPIVFTSAKTGQRVTGLFEVIKHVYSNRFIELDGAASKAFISQAIMQHKPTRGTGVSHPRIKYFKQTHSNPPTFEIGLYQKKADIIADSYLRFLKNLLRKQYDFSGTPIRLHVEARKKSHTT